MSKVIVTKEKLNDVAEAIREKTGGSDTLSLDQMPEEILSIPSGGGEKKYLHTIKYSSTNLNVSVFIISDNPSAMTALDVSKYLYNNNYKTFYTLYPLSSGYYTSEGVVGVYSSDSRYASIKGKAQSAGGYSDVMIIETQYASDTVKEI